MSVFRPLNSDESNLFTIRCVITATWAAAAATSEIIAGGSKVTVATDQLTTPTSNNLPDYFGIYHASGTYYVTYGKVFTSTPCVSIIPRMNATEDFQNDSGTDGKNPIPVTFWNNITDYGATWGSAPVSNSNYNFSFAFKEATTGNLITVGNDAGLINGFDLVITGPVKLGVTTGNSNKGWSVGSGNDANTAYSFMNVGIGTGNPTSALHINGRLDAFIYKSSAATDGPTGSTATLTAAQLFGYTLSNNPGAAQTLTTRTAVEIIGDLLSVKGHIAAVSDSFDLTIINRSTTDTNDITLAGGTGVTTTDGGSMIVYTPSVANETSGSGTFRFTITNITASNEAIRITRIA